MGAKSSNCGQPNSPFSSLCFLSIFMLLVVFHQLQYNEEVVMLWQMIVINNRLELFNFK